MRSGKKNPHHPGGGSLKQRQRTSEPASSGRRIYGVNPVLEALRAHPQDVECVFLAEGQPSGELGERARAGGIPVKVADRRRLAELAEGGVHQGVVAELRAFAYATLEELIDRAQRSGREPLLVVLDGIQDPHNLGAIIRSAHALGAHGVVIGKDRAAPVTGVVAKASAGALEHCPVARVVNVSRALEDLKQAGLWTAAADPRGEVPLWTAKLTGPLALVVGAEGVGIRPGVLDHCDLRVQIPMLGRVASLNASASAALLLYEVMRQRTGGLR